MSCIVPDMDGLSGMNDNKQLINLAVSDTCASTALPFIHSFTESHSFSFSRPFPMTKNENQTDLDRCPVPRPFYPPRLATYKLVK